VVAARPAAERGHAPPGPAVCCCTSVTRGLGTDAKPSLTRVEPTGLEPVTPCLQRGSMTDNEGRSALVEMWLDIVGNAERRHRCCTRPSICGSGHGVRDGADPCVRGPALYEGPLPFRLSRRGVAVAGLRGQRGPPADVACDRPDRRTGWARAVRSGLGTRAGGSGRAVTGACRGRSTALSGGFRTWPPMEGTEWLENCEDRRDEGVQSCGVRGSLVEPALSSRSF
jgi:hypothetical protein